MDKYKSLSTYRTGTGIQPFNSQFDGYHLRHLLGRTLFGVTRKDIQNLGGKPLDEVVELLLKPSPTPSPPVNAYSSSTYTDPVVPFGQTWVEAPYDGTANGPRTSSFKSWWMGQLLNQNTSIHEKMILFWHNHFATETQDVSDARLMFKHHSLLRKFALGNFKKMVKEITIDPAMLRYLNGNLNNKNSPDENYARELQELFTLGKGPKVGFTEEDVKSAARILTGYVVNSSSISSSFDPNRHDTGDKKFSSFYNNKIIYGRTGALGAVETDELIEMLFQQPETANHLCRKLYRFFIYYEIDAATEANVIEPLATILRSSDYEIKPVLKALFTSEHFFDPVNRASLIKSPLDFCAGLCREFGISFPNTSDLVNQYLMQDYLRVQASTMQQNLGDPPSVSGWPAYYQEPQFHELWINSDTLPKRNQLADVLMTSGYTRNGKKLNIDLLEFASSLKNPGNPNELIQESIDLLFAMELYPEVISFLKGILLSGQSSDSYWTDAWTSYQSNPNQMVTRNLVLNRLTSLFRYLINLPEYQLS
jgi:hypothetical protein